jgi:hypothetical protein
LWAQRRGVVFTPHSLVSPVSLLTGTPSKSKNKQLQNGLEAKRMQTVQPHPCSFLSAVCVLRRETTVCMQRCVCTVKGDCRCVSLQRCVFTVKRDCRCVSLQRCVFTVKRDCRCVEKDCLCGERLGVLCTTILFVCSSGSRAIPNTLPPTTATCHPYPNHNPYTSPSLFQGQSKAHVRPLHSAAQGSAEVSAGS